MGDFVSGISNAVGDLFGGGSQQGQYGAGTAPVYQPTVANQQTNDSYYQQLIQQMMGNNTAAQIYPQYQQYVSQIENNPYAAGAQTAATNAGTAATTAGNSAITNANTLTTAGNNTLPYSSTILNTAFDPQDALYNRTLQQLQDQTRASEAVRGIATSPVGASLENQNLENFNIDWQNNQLGRETQGLTDANSNNTNAANLFGDANTLNSSGITDINSGGSLPYNQYENNIGNILNALNTQGAAGAATNAVPQQTIQDIMSYLGYGQTASNNANNAAYQGFQNANQVGQNIGSLFGAVGGSNALSGAGSWLSSLLGGGGAAAGADGLGALASDAGVLAAL